MADIVFTYNGKRVSPSSGKVLGKKALPALASRSMRVDFKYDHFDPTTLTDNGGIGATWTHVRDDIYDFYYNNTGWGYRAWLNTGGGRGGLFNTYAYWSISGYVYPMTQHQFDVLDMDMTGVTDVSYLFSSAWSVQNIFSIRNTSSVTNFNFFIGSANRLIAIPSIPLFDTSSAANVNAMFQNTIYVESGSLAMYQQMTSQATPPSTHNGCFSSCGRGTVTGAAELAQIPTSWGGTMAE